MYFRIFCSVNIEFYIVIKYQSFCNRAGRLIFVLFAFTKRQKEETPCRVSMMPKMQGEKGGNPLRGYLDVINQDRKGGNMFKRRPKVLTPGQMEEIRTKDFFDMVLPGVLKFQPDHYILVH